MERKKQRARRDILAAAGHLIEERGYVEARMRDIAVSAGISYQTLYNYFPTKALILQALLTQDVEHIAQAVDHLIAGYQGDLLDTLNTINRTRLDAISHRDRDLWRVVSIELFRNQREGGHIYQLIDAGAHEKWLLHTWSLSVEWQFYIIYPLVLVAMRQFMSIKSMKLSILDNSIPPGL